MQKAVSPLQATSLSERGIIKIESQDLEYYLNDILEIESLSFHEPWTKEMFREETENPISTLLGIIDNSRLWGYICFWKVNDEVHLLNLAVYPEERGKGWGQRLITEMIDLAKRCNIKRIVLEVRERNFIAIRLYRKFGFKIIGKRPFYYKETGEDALLMELELIG